MAQQLFREFVVLFKSWPVDSTKGGRCLAEYIRKRFNKEFNKGELSEGVDVAYWQKALAELKPVANNEFAAKYPRSRATGALGLGREQCKLALSNEALKFLGDKENFKEN